MLETGQFARACTLARQLPAAARCVRALEPRAAWDEHAYLLALAVDNLSFLRYELAGGRGRRPKPLERPKPKPEAKKRLNVSGSRVEALLFSPRE